MYEEHYFLDKMNLSHEQLLLYNILLVIYLLYLMFRHRRSSTALFIIFLFFPGVFSDLGGKTANNIFQVVSLAWSVWLFLKTDLSIAWYKYKSTIILFVIYSIYFFSFSVLLHNDNPIMVFAQYSKVLTPFLLYIYLLDELEYNPSNVDYYHDLFGEILVSVIIASIFKLIIVGHDIEGWVGGLSGFHGGGAGTSLPMLGLLWLALQTKMQNSSIKDVLFIVGLLLIGMATGKRAIILLFPILYLLLSAYVYRNRISNIIIAALIVVPLIFYFGLRLSPTLNPENKVWGSFDPEYAFNYSLNYSTGIDRTKNVKSAQEMESGSGRIGAVYWMFEHIFVGDKKAWLGKGNEYIVYADHDDYFNKNYYMGISYRGGITGIVRTFLISGLVGVVLFVAFLIRALYRRKNRFAQVMLLTVLFDYIFYNAQILNHPAMFVMALFLVFCSEWTVTEPARPV